MPEFLRTGVPRQVGGPIGMTVRVAVEAGHSAARALRAPVFRGVELLLRERGHQQAQSLQLLGIQKAVEYLVVVVQRDQFALRNVTQIHARSEIDRRRKLRDQMVRKVEVQIEASQVAPLLLL